MLRPSILPLSLLVGAVSFSACKKSQKGDDHKPSAAAAKPQAAAEKIAKADAKKEDTKKADAKDAKPDLSKNCLDPAQPATAYVPGTVVSLPAPAGYRLARHYPGYRQADLKTKPSIVVSEFPMPVARAKAALSNGEVWKRQEMTLVDVKDVEHKGKAGSCSGTLIEIEKPGDTPIHKFVWLFGNEKQAFQIMGSCPEPCPAAEAKKLQDAIQSARWNPARSSKRWERLSFTLNPAPLKPMDAPMMSGYRRVYTETGLPDPKGEHTMFAFSSAVEPAKERTAEFAQKGLARLRLRNLEVTKKSKTKAFGLKGWTFEAKGDHRSGTEQLVQYTVLFDQDTYWTALGTCPMKNKKACKPVFKKIFKTVKLTDAI